MRADEAFSWRKLLLEGEEVFMRQIEGKVQGLFVGMTGGIHNTTYICATRDLEFILTGFWSL